MVMRLFRCMVRAFAWRLGRSLYMLARGEGRNEPSLNGEYWLQRKVLEYLGDGQTLMDVGANKGEWTANAVVLDASATIHAFEPSAATRALLSRRFEDVSQVKVHALALSSIGGTAAFYSKGAGAGTNSLDAVSGDNVETVAVSTCDAVLTSLGVDRVSMLKIDTEGFDFLVLQGASEALAGGRVDVVQFEYNWRWLLNHSSLRDVFDFIRDKPYRFGRLAEESIEFHGAWHFELDRFFENNYVLVLKGSPIEALGEAFEFDRSNVSVPVASP